MSSRLPPTPSRTALAAALAASGLCGRVGARDLVELPRRGLAHRHWRLRGTGLVLRGPITGAGEAALAPQAETLRRLAPPGHAPRLGGVLPPPARMPGGGLLGGGSPRHAPVGPRDF